MENHDIITTPSIDDSPSYKEDLALEWTLSLEEINFILRSVKGEKQLLYFAAQLKSLRNTGSFLTKENNLPDKVIIYLSKQIGIQPSPLVATSRNTFSTYRQKIKEYLGYQNYTEIIAGSLQSYLMQEMEKELFSITILKSKTCNWLKQQKVVQPSLTILNRLVISYRKEYLGSLYSKLANKLTPEQKRNMLSVLNCQPHLLSQVSYYKKSPPEPTASKINTFISRFNELKELGITEIDFSDISKAVFDELVLLGNTYDANALNQIISDNKKTTLLLCTLVDTSQRILDHILYMNDKLLAKKERISRNKFDKNLKKINAQAKKGLRFLVMITKTWLSHEDPENITLFEFQKTIDQKKLHEALTACEQMSDYQSKGYYQILEGKYNNIRQYVVNFFNLDFKGAVGTTSIINSIELLRKLNDKELKELPEDASTDFIPKKWRKIMSENKNVSRRTWEMALYYAVRNNIRSGDIYIDHSKKHRYFWNTVYSEEEWKKEKPEAFKALGLPEKFEDMLVILKNEFSQGVELTQKSLAEGSFSYIDSNGELRLRKEDALDIAGSTKKLKKMIEAKMGCVRIEKVLSDIDEKFNFSKFFIPPDGFEQKTSFNKKSLYAVIVALGTNLGLVDMSNSTEGISLETLKHIAQWCVRPEIITEANNYLVKKHNEHPLSKIYGDFNSSSSDGDRFCIQKSSNLASFYPKAFGYYQKVISIYTHLSDQYSVFSTQVISCGIREASYVLDGLLSNQMITNPHFHYTDTGGFTHHLFALCYLLGFSFQPRLKDLADQTLYKLDQNAVYGEIDSIFKGYIDINCISEQWEQFIRIIVSLKNHVAPAHLVLQKLAARSNSDRVAKALLELGRLIKTIYILHYLPKPMLRRKIHLQLNRGESRHYLARHIFFANQGEFKTGDYEEIMNIASCLSLLSNVVLLWNTSRIYSIIHELRGSGITVNDKDLKRISPLMFKHLIVHGIYDFKSL